MKILFAPDKFKGSISAVGVCEALRRGWTRIDPDVEIGVAPIADGGEGFTEALGVGLGGRWVEVETEDPLGRTILGRYAWMEVTQTAVLEMSEASGLWRVGSNERDPERANTAGTGRLMRDAIGRGARRILVGLGGSATTDGGMGMASALGCRFWDEAGAELRPFPSELAKVVRVDLSERLALPEVIAACDVQNPLLGKRGTAAVFAPQKGADAAMVSVLEDGLRNFSNRVAQALGRDFAEVPGVGAAGGLGFGLVAFCGARLQGGFDLVAEALELEGRMAGVDLVVTGEGRLDGQTLEGKGPAGVAAMARRLNKPVIAFAGSVEESAAVRERFDAVVPIVDRAMSLEEAMRDSAVLLERAAERTARLWQVALRGAG